MMCAATCGQHAPCQGVLDHKLFIGAKQQLDCAQVHPEGETQNNSQFELYELECTA